MTAKELPVLDLVPELLEQLRAHPVLALQAPPGAGKSTELPLHLIPDFATAQQRIILLQPRRLAVRTVAHRLAEKLGEQPGQQIGYRMRDEVRSSAQSVLEVQTEGAFLRMLQSDPALESVSLVIFDEYHERSLNADLCFALCRHSQLLFSDLRDQPLKLMLMSATLDNEGLQAAIPDMPWLISEGRQFPVSVHYETRASDALTQRGQLAKRVETLVLQALQQHEGNILVFLPGQSEILDVHSSLQSQLDPQHIQCRPLYGALSMKEQRLAIEAPPADTRKVVLATDIAETSLTIEGIHCVIDSGLAKKPVFVPRSGLTRLELQAIPRAAADQRAGRAGRLGPGHAYRLWSEEEHQRRARYRKPDIYSSDLCGPVLQCIAFGCSDPFELPWVEAPPRAPVSQAFKLLEQLQFLNGKLGHYQLSLRGELAMKLPLEPRLQALLMAAVEADCATLGCELALCLENSAYSPATSPDLAARLQQTRKDLAHGKNRRLQKDFQRYSDLCHQLGKRLKLTPVPEAFQLAWLCLQAFPDRLAKQQGGGTEYLMANGRGVQFQPSNNSVITGSDWLVVVDTQGRKTDQRDRIRCAVSVPAALMDSAFGPVAQTQLEMAFNKQEQRFEAREVKRIAAIELHSQPRPLPPLREATDMVLATVRESGLTFFEQWPKVQDWLSRLDLMTALDGGGTDWPVWSEAALLETLEQWLEPMLPTVKSWRDLPRMDLKAALETQLDWSLRQKLDREAPKYYEAPSGIRHLIDYSERPPRVELKLQELFSLRETPRIGNGRQPIKLHLLSPAGRPLAVTSDLGSFWAEVYPQVKAEMKGRYPKHPWPDDPLTAKPTVLTKRALQRDS